MNIVEALNHPKLFKGLFAAPSWRPWIIFLKALFALPLADDELETFQHHTDRRTAPLRPFREACLVVGRRGGKSRLLALVAVFVAVAADHGKLLAPGETPIIAIIAADRKQARVIFGYIRGLLHGVPMLTALIEEELAETIRLKNGVSIEIHTAAIASPRGRTFLAVLADECAFWPTDTAGANPDKEVIVAVRPGLATLPDSMLLVASSPYARRGYLYETFSRYFAKDDAPVLVWRGTTLEMNSSLDPRIVEEAYESDAESASAEYGAEFRSDITAFISREAVEAVVPRGVFELPPASGTPYVAFEDPSGGSTDPMTLAVCHVDANGIAVLDAIRERRPPFSPEDVVKEFCELLRSYGINRVHGDAYAGEWPRERHATHGVEYLLSDRNKSTIYQDFLPALNGQRIRLLDHSRLIGQAVGLERRTSRGGRDSIDHAPGSHDDLVNAVAGALTLAINDRRPTLIRASDVLIGGRGAEMPILVDQVFGVAVVDEHGTAATVFFGRSKHYGTPLSILDFDCRPLESGFFSWTYGRGVELAEQCRARRRGFSLFVEEVRRASVETEIAQMVVDQLSARDPGLRHCWIYPIPKGLIDGVERLVL